MDGNGTLLAGSAAVRFGWPYKGGTALTTLARLFVLEVAYVVEVEHVFFHPLVGLYGR